MIGTAQFNHDHAALLALATLLVIVVAVALLVVLAMRDTDA